MFELFLIFFFFNFLLIGRISGGPFRILEKQTEPCVTIEPGWRRWVEDGTTAVEALQRCERWNDGGEPAVLPGGETSPSPRFPPPI